MARDKEMPKAKDKGKAPAKPEPKSQTREAAKAVARSPAKPDSRAKPEQMSLEPEAAAAVSPVETPAAPPASVAGDVVVELLQNRKGYWKRLASGEGMQISEKEWQQELSRLLSRRATANDSGGQSNS